MSAETQSYSRKRRDRKKKKGDSDADKLDVKSAPDFIDDDDSCKDDTDEHESNSRSHHDDHSHGSSGSSLSTAIFFLLLGGLVILTSMIFMELKGSKEVGPSISESRYASILGDFVEEQTHDDDDHDVPQMYTEEEHGNEEDLELENFRGVGEGQFETISEIPEPADAPSTMAEAGVEEEESTTEDIADEITETSRPEESQMEFVSPELGISEEEEQQGGAEIEQETAEEQHQDSADVGKQQDEAERGREIGLEDQAIEQEIEPEEREIEPEEREIEPEEREIEPEEREIEPEERDIEPEERDIEPEEREIEPEEQENEPGEQENQAEKREIEPESMQNTADVTANENNPMSGQPEIMVDKIINAQEEVHSDPTILQSEDGEEERVQDDLLQSNIEETTESQPVQESTRDDMTDPYEFEFQDELNAADAQLENSRVAEQTVRVKAIYEDILRKHPASPRALYGIAKSFDRLSEQQNSNALLEQCIHAYQEVLHLPRIPNALFLAAGERCVDRMRFRGFIEKATRIQKELIRRFPSKKSLRNQLAVSYLLLGQTEMAKKVLEEVLIDFPSDGFAKVHLGFILKTSENNNKDAIKYLREGIGSEEPGTIDGRFYFHLGDALMREGLVDDAFHVYEDGVQKGLFLSVYQRSLYNIDGLTGRPWWTLEESTYGEYLKQLEFSWQAIKEEGLALLDEKKGGFLSETENLRDTGIWKQFELYSRGKKIAANCIKAPRTCKLIEGIPDAAGCKRGQVKFSIMHPGTHVWPHTGPTNCRLRAHLGLVVPDGVKIRVANETRSWIEGKLIVFDDSFEHEVWHTGKSIRLVLIVDLWHPELNEYQKQTMTPI